MMLQVQELAKQGQQSRSLTVTERIPAFLTAPCHLNVVYQVNAEEDYFLIHLRVNGELNIVCQRCIEQYKYPYDNSTVIAVCRNDERAEQLLELYECIVSSNWQVSIEELVIDELHLYVPQYHPEISECGNEINEILAGKNVSY